MNKYNGTKDTINISIHHTASANVSEPYDSSSYLYTVYITIVTQLFTNTAM